MEKERVFEEVIDMGEKQETKPAQNQAPDPENINYDVYNGLNLIDEDLGESYLIEGFNPLGEDFFLDENFILDVLDNNVEKYEIVSPDFIESGNKATAEAFELSAQNALNVINLLQEHINNPKTPEIVRKQMQKQILYILCRNQLIKVYLKRIKNEKDTLKMFEKMSAINWQLSKTLQDSFNQQFNARKAMRELEELAKKKAEQESSRHRRRWHHRGHRYNLLAPTTMPNTPLVSLINNVLSPRPPIHSQNFGVRDFANISGRISSPQTPSLEGRVGTSWRSISTSRVGGTSPGTSWSNSNRSSSRSSGRSM